MNSMSILRFIIVFFVCNIRLKLQWRVLTLNLVSSYIIEGRVCYLTMCDRAYPKKLSFQYLEDLKNEFERVYGNQIETAARPYAFIKFGEFVSILSLFFIPIFFSSYFCFFWYTQNIMCFVLIMYWMLLRLLDTFILKTKKLYQDTRTQRNISKLNDELYEVHQIMTRNVQEVLGVGEKLDRKWFYLLYSHS